MRRRFALAIILSVAGVCLTSAAAKRTNLEGLLARPISPGVLALLLEHAHDARVSDRWAEGIHDSRSPVRAIAARVAGISNSSSLEGAVRDALRREADLDAAREQVRAIGMLGGPAAQADLLDAARRLGEPIAEVVAETLVRRSALSGLWTYFSELRKLAPSEDLMAWVIHAGTQAYAGVRQELADRVLGDGDVEAWHVLLAQSEEDDVTLDRDTYMRALRHDTAPIRAETAWHLVRYFSGAPPPDSSDWLAALEDGAPVEEGPGKLADSRFGITLLGRVLGREAETDPRWIDFLAGSVGSHIDGVGMDGWALEFLTSQEKSAIQERFNRLFGPRKLATKRPERRPPAPKRRVLRAVTGYPRGFVADLVQVTGCRRFTTTADAVEADLFYDQGGRPRQVYFISVPTAEACKTLAAGLMTTSIPPPKHLPDPKVPERLVLFLEKGFLERLDETQLTQFPRYLRSLGDGTGPTPPERTKFVAPHYPTSARERRIEGKVIMELVVTPAGIVNDIEVLKVTDDSLYAESMRAVSQWRYKPATLKGRPIAVNLTVIVEYSLR